MSLKIKDESGKVVGVLEDNASEPEMEKDKECCGDKCKCKEETTEEEGDKE